jgi:hypothetical protein
MLWGNWGSSRQWPHERLGYTSCMSHDIMYAMRCHIYGADRASVVIPKKYASVVNVITIRSFVNGKLGAVTL